MYTEARLALAMIAAAAILVSGWFAARSIKANLTALRGWSSTHGLVRGIAPGNAVEVEIGDDPDTRRVVAPVAHTIGAAFLAPVTVYLDPADPNRARLGGLLQMWLWPATMAALCAVACLVLFAAATVGRGHAPAGAARPTGWRFSPRPEPDPDAIVVHGPASEARAPLWWSLLGLAALACGIFAPAAPFQRLALLMAGITFTLLTWGLAWYNRSMTVSAGPRGVLAATAFGWHSVPWEAIHSVELREAATTQKKPFELIERLPFPGNTTRGIVFADARGFSLLRVSEHMQPPEAMHRLMQLCEARTGQHEQFRHFRLDF